MATKKSKSKITREDIKINIPQADPAQLAKFAETPEGKDSPFFAMPDGSGVTIGTPPQPHQIDGEGLPELGDDRVTLNQWHLNFDVRASYDSEGNTYLEVARPGSGVHHQFRYCGRDYHKAFLAAGQFNNRFEVFLIYFAMDCLFESLFWEKSSAESRDDSYKAIMKSFENYFKTILKPKRPREIGKREIGPGITVTSFELIGTGREPKTEAEKKAEKEAFLEQVFRAFSIIETEGGKRTQLDVGNIIFEYAQTDDIQSLMKNRCRTYGLRWSDVKAEYDRKKV